MKKTKNYNKSRMIVLREKLKLSQKEFSDSVGISQGGLSLLESEKSKLSLDTLKKISQTFKVNCNWLVNGDGSIFIDRQGDEQVEVKTKMHQMDINGSSLIPLIMEEARAGYPQSCNDSDFINKLDVYKIPGYEEGNYRMFEIEGDSMMPSIHPREIVVAEFIEDWDSLENGKICVVITHDDIVAKRVYLYDRDMSVLVLKSDNANFNTYSVPLDKVQEIWEVKAKITSVFKEDGAAERNKMEQIQRDLDELKEQMKALLAKK